MAKTPAGRSNQASARLGGPIGDCPSAWSPTVSRPAGGFDPLLAAKEQHARWTAIPLFALAASTVKALAPGRLGAAGAKRRGTHGDEPSPGWSGSIYRQKRWTTDGKDRDAYRLRLSLQRGRRISIRHSFAGSGLGDRLRDGRANHRPQHESIRAGGRSTWRSAAAARATIHRVNGRPSPPRAP